jgi:hypothetical protein
LYDDNINIKNLIVNSFIKGNILNNYYITKEEDKIWNLYFKDSFFIDKEEILDDLSPEYNIN